MTGDGERRSDDVRRAVAEIRREGLKAAALVAVVDAAFVALLANLAATVVGVPELAATVAGPATVGTLLAAALGLLAGVAEFAWRARRPTVERFEEVNPAVHEALRTARDAVESDHEGPVARALYADVLDRLRDTSSRDLVAWRRLGATLVLVLAVSAATVGISAAGVGLTPDRTGIDAAPGDAAPGGGVDVGEANGSEGLQDPDEILGEATNVSAGDENVTAEIDAGTGGQGDRRSYDEQGYADDGGGGVDARRAGYADAEGVEDADLIRRFTLALQDDDEDRNP